MLPCQRYRWTIHLGAKFLKSELRREEDPGLAMFVVALLNALGREGRGNRPTEVVLMLALGESGTAERGRNRLMRWQRGEMSGHDLAREPGLVEQRDHRLGEMPLPVQPA